MPSTEEGREGARTEVAARVLIIAAKVFAGGPVPSDPPDLTQVKKALEEGRHQKAATMSGGDEFLLKWNDHHNSFFNIMQELCANEVSQSKNLPWSPVWPLSQSAGMLFSWY